MATQRDDDIELLRRTIRILYPKTDEIPSESQNMIRLMERAFAQPNEGVVLQARSELNNKVLRMLKQVADDKKIHPDRLTQFLTFQGKLGGNLKMALSAKSVQLIAAAGTAGGAVDFEKKAVLIDKEFFGEIKKEVIKPIRGYLLLMYNNLGVNHTDRAHAVIKKITETRNIDEIQTILRQQKSLFENPSQAKSDGSSTGYMQTLKNTKKGAFYNAISVAWYRSELHNPGTRTLAILKDNVIHCLRKYSGSRSFFKSINPQHHHQERAEAAIIAVGNAESKDGILKILNQQKDFFSASANKKNPKKGAFYLAISVALYRSELHNLQASALATSKDKALDCLQKYSDKSFSFLNPQHHHQKRAEAVMIAVVDAESKNEILQILHQQKDFFSAFAGRSSGASSQSTSTNSSSTTSTNQTLGRFAKPSKHTKQGGFYDAVVNAIREVERVAARATSSTTETASATSPATTAANSTPISPVIAAGTAATTNTPDNNVPAPKSDVSPPSSKIG